MLTYEEWRRNERDAWADVLLSMNKMTPEGFYDTAAHKVASERHYAALQAEHEPVRLPPRPAPTLTEALTQTLARFLDRLLGFP